MFIWSFSAWVARLNVNSPQCFALAAECFIVSLEKATRLGRVLMALKNE